METTREIIMSLNILSADIMEAYKEATGENLLDMDNEIYRLLEILPGVIKEEKKSHAIGFVDEITSVISKDGITDFYRNSEISKAI
tara:strand:- start:1016 stop:1273 length:258 start_codon:yes stop_codon:yes gene_type:complete